MNHFKAIRIWCALLLLGISATQSAWGQCSYYPVSVEERVANSSHIVIGRLLSKHPYWDRKHEIINTLNIIEVTAYLKGHRQDRQIGVITRGGVLEYEAMISYPSLELDPYNEYVLFLQGDNQVLDHPGIRNSNPALLQVETYADGQGAITKQGGVYHDLLVLPELEEGELMGRIKALTQEDARTPEGTKFSPRLGDTYPLSDYAASQRGAMPIASFTPTTSFAGTIVPADFLTINGSGFGAAAGTVFYRNADDGGATFTSSGVATDNLAWSDVQIQNKIARRAGTGVINVNGAMTSAGTLTLQYAHIDINSSFSGFGSNTRQRYYLRNLNGTGGYTFQYNTTFNADVAAKAAFERAVDTWRCATFVNFNYSTTTTAVAAAASDGVNCVFYNGALPAGVLGRATTQFQGSGSVGCTVTNTVWWANELDIEFKTNPPSAGFTWEFGPAAPSASEFDFESVALHELGHLHGLGHVIANGTVMHFSLTNGTSVRTLTANDIAGGNAKMGYSTAATCFNPAGSGTPMVALNSGNCSLLSVNSLMLDGWHVPGIGNKLVWALSEEAQIGLVSIQKRIPGEAFATFDQMAHSNQNSYSIVDSEISQSTVWEYRLLIHHLDGHVEASDVLTIQFELEEGLQVMPTVVQDRILVEGKVAQGEQPILNLIDLQGKTLIQALLSANNGMVSQSVGLEGLPAGVYIYRISGTARPLSGKLVVVD